MAKESDIEKGDVGLDSSFKDENLSSATPSASDSAKSEKAELSPNLEENGEGELSDLMKAFRYAEKPEVVLYSVGALAAIASGTSMPLMTVIFGGFVTTSTDFATGKASAGEYMDSVEKHTLYFVYLFVARFVVTYVYNLTLRIASVRITRRLRTHFLSRTLHQETDYFNNLGAGATATLVTSNSNRIQHALGEKLGLLIYGMSMFFSAIIIAYIADWKLALIASSMIPVLFAAAIITTIIDVGYEGPIGQALGKASTLAEEILGSVRTVKSLDATIRLADSYRQWLAAARDRMFKKNVNLGLQLSSEFFVTYAGYGLVFWRGIRMYESGEIKDAGTVVTVFLSMLMAVLTLVILAPHFPAFAKAMSAATEMMRIIERQSQIDSSKEDGKVLESLCGDIEFRNVEFAYASRPDVKVLQGISFHVPAHKVTALVGASGSGKSTTIGLLERWVDSTKGGIYLDGVEIRDLNLKWLRRQMGLVQQEPVLFNDTIFNNVAYGLVGTEFENAPEEKKRELVKEACIKANADEFIQRLPDGYNTSVGDRGSLLSGGQKQRVAIARSIIRNPPILLLDEATSALDSRSEGIVQEALDKASAEENRTTIVIAHKLATIRKADKIIVFGKGEVLEEGTHEELVAKGGAYKRLVDAQDLSSADEEENAEQAKATRALSRHKSAAGNQVEEVKEDDGDIPPHSYGLYKCLMILLRKQLPSLWPWYLVCLVASLIGGAIYPIQAVLFAELMEAFEMDGPRMVERGDFCALMFFVVSIVILIAYFGVGYGTNVMCSELVYTYRYKLFESFLAQPISFFDKPANTAGGLTTKLSVHPQHLQDLVGVNLTLIIVIIVNITSSSILALVVGWKLALVTIFTALPLIFLSGFWQYHLEGVLENETADLFAESGRFASEAVGAVRTVHSLTLEDTVCGKYDGMLSGMEYRAVKKSFKTMVFFSIAYSLELLCMALAFYYGGKLMSSGEYNSRQFYVVFIAVIFSAQAGGTFFAFTPDMSKARKAANYMIWLESMKGEDRGTDEKDWNGDDDDMQGDVEYDHVSFAYASRPDTKVLKDLSFKAHKGEFIALVGPSGCGKSTTISTLLRFYDPTTGRINLDGTPINQYPLSKYRSYISLVAQEPTLYSGTLRENLTLGLSAEFLEKTPAEELDRLIQHACEQANIWSFITSLSEGLQTECGTRGASFSGGQRQRLAIARAIIRDPKVLLLDEATSALDTESERVVQRGIEEGGKGRTVIAVAHRLSTVRNADKIIVLRDGLVCEAGRHDELIAQKGVYYQMCEAQRLDRAV